MVKIKKVNVSILCGVVIISSRVVWNVTVVEYLEFEIRPDLVLHFQGRALSGEIDHE